MKALRNELVEELMKKIPEDAPMIKDLISKGERGTLLMILSDRAVSCLDPEVINQSLKKGDVASVLASSERALEIRRLRKVVFEEF